MQRSVCCHDCGHNRDLIQTRQKINHDSQTWVTTVVVGVILIVNVAGVDTYGTALAQGGITNASVNLQAVAVIQQQQKDGRVQQNSA